MPVLPEVGSTMTLSGAELARPLRRIDHRQRDAVLDRRERVEELELDEDLGLAAELRRQAVETDQRRIADRLADGPQDPLTAGRCGTFRPCWQIHGHSPSAAMAPV